MAYMPDYSMSENAAAAYRNGEMPLSKWTKKAILDSCGAKAAMLEKMTLAELRKTMLIKSSWHHTSSHYNETDFYQIDEDKLEKITEEDIAVIVASRQPRREKDTANDEIVNAEITYTVWLGQYRNYRKPKQVTETIQMRMSDKMIKTAYGNKRASSMDEIRFL